jgi:hypothetical protein
LAGLKRRYHTDGKVAHSSQFFTPPFKAGPGAGGAASAVAGLMPMKREVSLLLVFGDRTHYMLLKLYFDATLVEIKGF